MLGYKPLGSRGVAPPEESLELQFLDFWYQYLTSLESGLFDILFNEEHQFNKTFRDEFEPSLNMRDLRQLVGEYGRILRIKVQAFRNFKSFRNGWRFDVLDSVVPFELVLDECEFIGTLGKAVGFSCGVRLRQFRYLPKERLLLTLKERCHKLITKAAQGVFDILYAQRARTLAYADEYTADRITTTQAVQLKLFDEQPEELIPLIDEKSIKDVTFDMHKKVYENSFRLSFAPAKERMRLLARVHQRHNKDSPTNTNKASDPAYYKLCDQIKSLESKYDWTTELFPIYPGYAKLVKAVEDVQSTRQVTIEYPVYEYDNDRIIGESSESMSILLNTTNSDLKKKRRLSM